MNKLPTKYKPTLRLMATSVAIILSAFILSSFFFRFDLTSEKRYTLSDFSKETLKNLDDIVFVRVYLDGDLNIPFRKMQQYIRETLDEFKVYAGDNLEYEFINPFEDEDIEIQQDVIQQLYDQGLQPTNIISTDREGGSAQKIVFPGAIVNFRGVEVPLNLLKDNQEASAEEDINNSVQALEFEFIRIINSLSLDSTEKIAFLEGHGELDEIQVGDLTRELGWFFQVDRGRISGNPGVLDEYKVVVIAKPLQAFSEQDKFVIDQYIMNGGRVLWFIDMVQASLDSLGTDGTTIALLNQLGIEDMLFRYGVRINPDLVQDMQCNIIPVNLALPGNNPNFQPAPWLYYPLLSAPREHPLTRNLNLIKTEFISSIDTIGSRPDVKKTALLSTSEMTRLVSVPAMIRLDEIAEEQDPAYFNVSGKPVAVLLEGSFESAFRNRMLDDIIPGASAGFRQESLPTSMLVVSDGDMIRNDMRITEEGILITPLGYDRYTQETYGNKEFIVNSIHYMTGHEDLLRLRSRDLTLRMLDKTRIAERRTFYVLLNTLLPPFVVILAGILFAIYRRKQYAAGAA